MRALLLLAALFAALLTAPPATAQSYPAKPIKVISPYAPGGGLDVILRPLLQKMGEGLGQSLYIDNRSGANGMIGIEAGAKSPPDGYTLIGVTSGAVTINPNVYSKMPYDTAKDIVPVVNVASAPFVMVVHPSVPARNVKEFIALAKADDGKLSYGSPGVGGTNHLGAEYFLQLTHLKMIHVPYRGSQPLMTDLVGGQVKMAFDSIMATLPFVRSGKLRALGVVSAKRTAIAPEIPTLVEEGGPKFELNSWYGIMAPAGTPPQIVARINAEAVKALADPQVKAVYANMGNDIIGNTPAQFAAQIREDTARWGEVAKAANVRAD
ncbi:MAG: tripartite tricarboxylate transporter receptor family protein [Betaproteobacteria bacterium]|nr:tripartite tricarboxylate transporter receptor family protein [Betaproteobacteria bacterium]